LIETVTIIRFVKPGQWLKLVPSLNVLVRGHLCKEFAMIEKRPAANRGHANYGWLDTWHSFSFADYHDPAQMGWGSLRVINDDVIAAGRGFGTHGHRDMEIISVVLEGELEHKDSMGNGAVIRPGEVQRMSAGKGVMHSEFNPSPHSPARLLQIWIQPDVRGGSPSYEQKEFDPIERAGRWQTLASHDGRAGSVTIQQDAALLATKLAAGKSLQAELAPGRKAYVHVISGSVRVGDIVLAAGDGAKVADESRLDFAAIDACELLYFDLNAEEQA
jgi:quercetin 2,3-dioxygenase